MSDDLTLLGCGCRIGVVNQGSRRLGTEMELILLAIGGILWGMCMLDILGASDNVESWNDTTDEQ